MSENYKQFARQRESECRAESAAFNERLGFFAKTNWITVLVPSLLAVCAGSVLFSSDNWKWLLGLAALAGALLTAIHRGLDCDAHQAECRRLTQAYSGLAIRYRTLHEVEKEDGLNTFLELEEALAHLKETATARLLVRPYTKPGRDGVG